MGIEPVRILVVCTANVCRSPMAAAFLSRGLERAGVPAQVVSAGLNVREGSPAVPEVVETMRGYGIELSEHRSRLLTPGLAQGAHIVLGLTREHLREAIMMDQRLLDSGFTVKELARRAGTQGFRPVDTPLQPWLTALTANREIEDVKRLGLDGRVVFAGHVADPAPLLAESDVLVHSSVIPEPFGLVVVEGMAAGLPVVASDAGGPAETIEHGVDGLLSRMGDAQRLATALRRLADDSELRESLSVRARESARRYAPEPITERIERVYDAVVAGTPRRARHVVVNGRYRGRAITGVERFATNITARMESPARTVSPPAFLPAQGLLGHLWEQTVLPLHVGRQGILWNACNFGPMLLRRQILTVHDIAPVDHPEWFDPKYQRWFRIVVSVAGRRALAVTTVSHFSGNRLADRMGIDRDRIHIVPNGCSLASDRLAVAGRALPERAPYALTIGKADPRKNASGVQEATRQLQAVHPGLELRIVGVERGGVFASNPGPDVDGNGAALGHVTDDDLVDLYRGAGCLVFASFYEGFGLPPLEAMALGTRVVTSRLPPIEELCGDTAIYIDPADPADIARGMHEALSEPESRRREVIDRAQRRAHEFSWTRAARAFDALAAQLWLSPNRGHRDA